MRVITVRLPEHLIKNIDKVCIITGKSRSEIIREALAKYLGRWLWEEKNMSKYS